MLQLTFDINRPITCCHIITQLCVKGRGESSEAESVQRGEEPIQGRWPWWKREQDKIWVKKCRVMVMWGGNGKKRFLLYLDGSSFHIWFFEFCLYIYLIPGCHWWACLWRQLVTRAEMVRCPLLKFKGRPGSPPATSKSGLPTPPVQCLWGIVREFGIDIYTLVYLKYSKRKERNPLNLNQDE